MNWERAWFRVSVVVAVVAPFGAVQDVFYGLFHFQWPTYVFLTVWVTVAFGLSLLLQRGMRWAVA